MTIDLIIIEEHENATIHTSKLCKIEEVERLKQQTTIGRLLNELHKQLEIEQIENPDSEATKEFKKNLDLLEKAYKEEIPKSVEDYRKEYQIFITDKLPKVEDQFKTLVHWTDDDDNPGAELRSAISKLRYECYDQPEAYLKTEWEQARYEFKNGKCCREQALVLQKKIQENFEYYKKFKEQVNNWFKEIDDIYKQAETILKTTENYNVVYAYRLELESILKEVKQLRGDETSSSPIAKDHEWLKSLLVKILWRYCIVSYESFYWYKNWLEIVKRDKKSQENYEVFKKVRKDNFIREAQDVEPDTDLDTDLDTELEDDITVTVVEEQIHSKTPQHQNNVVNNSQPSSRTKRGAVVAVNEEQL